MNENKSYFRMAPSTPSGEQLNGSIFRSDGENSSVRRIEVLREVLRILQQELHHQPLARRVKVHALDRGQRGGVQQATRRLARHLHILVQHAGSVVAGFDHERVAFEATDRMTERRALAVLRMFALVKGRQCAAHPSIRAAGSLDLFRARSKEACQGHPRRAAPRRDRSGMPGHP